MPNINLQMVPRFTSMLGTESPLSPSPVELNWEVAQKVLSFIMLMAGSDRQNGEEKGDLISAKEETWNHFQHTHNKLLTGTDKAKETPLY